MPPIKKLSEEAVLKVPAMLSVVIRWKNNIGSPSGDPCSGFRIRVEQEPPNTVSDTGGGSDKITPGPDIWRFVTDSATCYSAPDESDSHVVHFTIRDVQVNENLIGQRYRVTPQLTGNWDSRGLVFLDKLGFQYIDPPAWYVTLLPSTPIATGEFEVVRRSRES